MAKTKYTYNLATKLLRWFARAIGSLLAAVCLLLLIFSDKGVSNRVEILLLVILLGLFITTVLGVGIAWWREKIGGIILVICAIAMVTLHFIGTWGAPNIGNRVRLMLIFGVPILVPGILFLVSYWKSSRSKIPQNSA